MSESPAYDVAVIGCGPSGAALANLLGRAGRSVLVLERADRIYDLPRAVSIDGEIMRLCQALDLLDEVQAITEPIRSAEFVDPDGKRLVGIDVPPGFAGPDGFAASNFFYQPELERVLRAGAQRHAGVELRLGCELLGFEHDDRGARLRFRDEAGVERAARASFLIGADGAGSFVRRQLGIAFQSLDYDREWLVVDLLLTRDGVGLPHAAQQICDPERPSTFIPAVGRHRRWEFQLLPGERAADLERDERVWELLRPWIGPEDARIIRSVVYEFHGTLAERWRDGRVFLIGDAAHQMPPFLGQGMCAGLRDVANLGWKLVEVLAGRAPERLLETYESERKPHADDIVAWAIEVGKLIDHFAEAFAGRREPPTPEQAGNGYGGSRRMRGLGNGCLQEPRPEGRNVGKPFPQSRVRGPDGPGRLLDAWLGDGFALAHVGPLDALCDPAERDVWTRRGARFVALDALEPLDGWLSEVRSRPAIHVIRPDRYLAGVAETPAAFAALTRELGRWIDARGEC